MGSFSTLIVRLKWSLHSLSPQSSLSYYLNIKRKGKSIIVKPGSRQWAIGDRKEVFSLFHIILWSSFEDCLYFYVFLHDEGASVGRLILAISSLPPEEDRVSFWVCGKRYFRTDAKLMLTTVRASVHSWKHHDVSLPLILA